MITPSAPVVDATGHLVEESATDLGHRCWTLAEIEAS